MTGVQTCALPIWNRENLLKSIEAFELQLDLIKQGLVENDEQILKKLFINSSKRRENLEK